MDYSSEVKRRFESRGGNRDIAPETPGASVAGEAEDKALNVWVRFEVQVRSGFIRGARFQVYGCPHTIAAASWTADWLQGKPAACLQRLDVECLRRDLGVPTQKVGKLLRIEDAVSACAERLAAAVEIED